jgi:hypothetical protein
MWRHCNNQAVFCRQLKFGLDKFNAAVLGATATPTRRKNVCSTHEERCSEVV